MPTSKIRRRNRTTRPDGVRRGRRLADPARPLLAGRPGGRATLTGAEESAVAASVIAEEAGDPVEAWHHYSQVDLFAHSQQARLLHLLAQLGDAAPGWMWCRWMTEQARRTPVSPEDTIEPLIERVLAVCYPGGLRRDEVPEGLSPEGFLVRLVAGDWVLRQLVVYDDGGLRRLLGDRAGPRLLARADHVVQWAEAPMGGYRLDSQVDRCLQVSDLATGDRLDVLDLGAGAEHEPGSHLLGRLVPTDSRPGLMFEWAPLRVGRGTARAVAADPDHWVRTLTARVRSGQIPRGFSSVEGTGFDLDLPAARWLGLLDHSDLTHPDHLAPAAHHPPRATGCGEGSDAVERVAVAVLEKVLRIAPLLGPRLLLVRHELAGLVHEPALVELIEERFCRPEHARAWRLVGSVLDEPARGRCHGYADLGAAGAAGAAGVQEAS